MTMLKPSLSRYPVYTPHSQSGYWQVEMAIEDKEKIVFTTLTGLWQFNEIAFGLGNASATFERLMENVL